MAKAYLQNTVAVNSSPEPAKLAKGTTLSSAPSRKHKTGEGVAIMALGAAAIGLGLWEWLHNSSSPLPAGSASQCPFSDQTLVVDTETGGVFIISSGIAVPISSKADFNDCGYSAGAVEAVEDSQIQLCSPSSTPVDPPNCPTGPQGTGYPSPNCLMGGGLLAQVAGTEGVYITDCGTGPGGEGCETHAITSEAIMDACGYSGQHIYGVLLPILEATPLGADITPSTCIPLYSCGSGGPGAGSGGPGYRRAGSRRRHL